MARRNPTVLSQVFRSSMISSARLGAMCGKLAVQQLSAVGRGARIGMRQPASGLVSDAGLIASQISNYGTLLLGYAEYVSRTNLRWRRAHRRKNQQANGT
jgi:hypothetical protein